ncbi:MAG: hypothetical protein MK033_04685 [Candidatus Caenarcaniphilales bacterium]|nr:hypothetical protein [Candidatus Caenarcaniphilales bacterium]
MVDSIKNRTNIAGFKSGLDIQNIRKQTQELTTNIMQLTGDYLNASNGVPSNKASEQEQKEFYANGGGQGFTPDMKQLNNMISSIIENETSPEVLSNVLENIQNQLEGNEFALKAASSAILTQQNTIENNNQAGIKTSRSTAENLAAL